MQISSENYQQFISSSILVLGPDSPSRGTALTAQAKCSTSLQARLPTTLGAASRTVPFLHYDLILSEIAAAQQGAPDLDAPGYR